MPDLLTWTQDCNWPITEPLADFLASDAATVGPLADILQRDDEAWKYNCINLIVKKMAKEIVAGLACELERLATQPSVDDLRNEVLIAAREAFEQATSSDRPRAGGHDD